MHTLDNDPVLLGDSVFAVGYGVGRVTELLTESRFRVQFSMTNQSMTFDERGFMARARARSLYWQDPVVVAPAKDDGFWNALRPSIQSLAAALRPLV